MKPPLKPLRHHSPGGRSFPSGGPARSRKKPCQNLMRKNIHFVPSGEIERSTRRQEFETGARELGAALARQHAVERLFQAVEIGDVVRRIGELFLAQLR